MCLSADGRPPIDANDVPARSEDRTLSAADGAEFAAFAARAEQLHSGGGTVLPDERGLLHLYEELAVRFAEQGMVSVAIDDFGRAAGVGKRDEEFPYEEHVARMMAEQVGQDVGVAVAAPGASGSPCRQRDGGSLSHPTAPVVDRATRPGAPSVTGLGCSYVVLLRRSEPRPMATRGHGDARGCARAC